MTTITVALTCACLLIVGCPQPPPGSQRAGGSAAASAAASPSLAAALEGIESGLSDGGTRIHVGLTRNEVEALAGKSTAIVAGVLPDGPFGGPQEGLDAKRLDSDRGYEEWRYTLDSDTFYVFFGDEKLERPEWKVVAVIPTASARAHWTTALVALRHSVKSIVAR